MVYISVQKQGKYQLHKTKPFPSILMYETFECVHCKDASLGVVNEFWCNDS